jgi:beta-N-acetylhexosaminidase
MTLEEKIGQMLLFGWRADDEDAPSPSEGYPGAKPEQAATTLNAGARRLLDEWKVGGVILMGRNVETPEQVARLANDFQAAAGPVPVFFSTDQEGGHVARMKAPFTMMPGNMPLGATRDETLAYAAAHAVGEELTAIGINLNFGPSADVNNNPDNPIIGVRSYGEDPELVAGMVAAQVKGYQDAGAISCAKHFPGHGDTAVDSHLGLATIPYGLDRLERLELVPFKAAIAAGVSFIMTAHIVFKALDPDRPATLSPIVVDGLLRRDLGYDGVVITDCMEMKGIMSHYGIAQAAVMAVEAGVDVLAVCHTPSRQEAVRNALLEAVRSGRISEARIDQSVARILGCKAKFRLDERRAVDLDAVPRIVGSEEHRSIEQEIARKSITVVQDDADRIPIVGGESVVVIGPAEAAKTVAARLSTLRQAPVSSTGVGPEFSAEELASARQAVEGADAVVLLTKHPEPWTVVPQNEAAQADLARELEASGIPLIVVGLRNPYDLRHFPDIPTYAVTYGYTAASLSALAEVLAGTIPAQGRLPVTLPTEATTPAAAPAEPAEDTTQWGF